MTSDERREAAVSIVRAWYDLHPTALSQGEYESLRIVIGIALGFDGGTQAVVKPSAQEKNDGK